MNMKAILALLLALPAAAVAQTSNWSGNSFVAQPGVALSAADLNAGLNYAILSAKAQALSTLSAGNAYSLYQNGFPALTAMLYGSLNPSRTGLIFQSADDSGQPSKFQVQAAFGLAPTSGAAATSEQLGSRVTLWSDMAAQAGSGDAWAANFLVGLAAGFTGHLGMGLEIDVGNSASHRGDGIGYAGQRFTNADSSLNPALVGLDIDGNSTYRATAALRLAGQAAGGGLWNYGISVDRNSIAQVTFGDFSNAPISIQDWGTHGRWADLSNATYSLSAILFAPGQTLNAKDNGGTERVLISGRATDGAVVLGNGQLAYVQGPLQAGSYKMINGTVAVGVDLSVGGFTDSAIKLPPGATINAIDNSAAGHVLMSGRATDGAVMLGNGQATVANGTMTATSYLVGSNQVVGARQTGWTTPSYSTVQPSYGALNYDSATLGQVTARLLAVELALRTHGLIGN